MNASPSDEGLERHEKLLIVKRSLIQSFFNGCQHANSTVVKQFISVLKSRGRCSSPSIISNDSERKGSSIARAAIRQDGEAPILNGLSTAPLNQAMALTEVSQAANEKTPETDCQWRFTLQYCVRFSLLPPALLFTSALNVSRTFGELDRMVGGNGDHAE